MKIIHKLSAFIMLITIALFTGKLAAQQTQKMNTTPFEIPEAGIVFDAPHGWSFFAKTGKLEQGKVQYSYSHDQVSGKNRTVNPSITITVDKGSWFTDEKNYLDEKIGFYSAMGDKIDKTHSYKDQNNPLKLKQAYYTTGISGQEDHPYGQQYMLITFWDGKIGFHMEIQTSEKDLKTHRNTYDTLLKSIRKM